MNGELLRRYVAFKGDTQRDLAAKLGITPMSVCRKMKDKNSFTLAEVVTIAKMYNLSRDEIFNIFFDDLDV